MELRVHVFVNYVELFWNSLDNLFVFYLEIKVEVEVGVHEIRTWFTPSLRPSSRRITKFGYKVLNVIPIKNNIYTWGTERCTVPLCFASVKSDIPPHTPPPPPETRTSHHPGPRPLHPHPTLNPTTPLKPRTSPLRPHPVFTFLAF